MNFIKSPTGIVSMAATGLLLCSMASSFGSMKAKGEVRTMLWHCRYQVENISPGPTYAECIDRVMNLD